MVGEGKIAEAFFRLRAFELQSWLDFKTPISSCMDQEYRILMCLLPLEVRSTGPSGSLAMFLALMKLYFKEAGLRIWPKIAVTGVL